MGKPGRGTYKKHQSGSQLASLLCIWEHVDLAEMMQGGRAASSTSLVPRVGDQQKLCSPECTWDLEHDTSGRGEEEQELAMVGGRSPGRSPEDSVAVRRGDEEINISSL